MKKNACIAAAVISTVLGFAEGAGAETLQEALANAYNTNPTLLARRARLRAADEQVPQALSGWRPTVSATAGAGRGVIKTDSAKRTASPRDLGLSIRQPVFNGGGTVARTDQAEATVRAERASLSSTEQTVLLEAAGAYMDVLRDLEVLKLNQNNVQVLQRQLQAARDRFQVGEITRTDVSQAEARLAGAEADRVAAEGNLQTSRANYLALIGAPAANLSSPPAIAGLPGSLDDVIAQAATGNPTVVAAEQTATAAGHGIDVTRAELLPSVSLNGNAQRNYDALSSGTNSRILQATVNLTVPLYQAGADYSRLREQKHVAGQRRIEVDQARRDAVENAARSWEGLVSARARVQSYTTQINAAQLALEGVEREAQVGSRTILDVLDAEQELLNAQVNRVRAGRDEVVAALQVKSAVGELTAQSLGLPVEIYDPTKNYDEVRDQWVGASVDDYSTTQPAKR